MPDLQRCSLSFNRKKKLKDASLVNQFFTNIALGGHQVALAVLNLNQS